MALIQIVILGGGFGRAYAALENPKSKFHSSITRTVTAMESLK